MSELRKILVTGVLFFIAGVFIGIVFGVFGGHLDGNEEAVREGHAHYEVDKGGRPVFKWNPRCGDVK